MKKITKLEIALMSSIALTSIAGITMMQFKVKKDYVTPLVAISAGSIAGLGYKRWNSYEIENPDKSDKISE